jgi:hypothetical protein
VALEGSGYLLGELAYLLAVAAVVYQLGVVFQWERVGAVVCQWELAYQWAGALVYLLAQGARAKVGRCLSE